MSVAGPKHGGGLSMARARTVADAIEASSPIVGSATAPDVAPLVAIVGAVGEETERALRRVGAGPSRLAPGSLAEATPACVVAHLPPDAPDPSAILGALREVRARAVVLLLADADPVPLLTDAAHVVLPTTASAELIAAQALALLALRAAATEQPRDVVAVRSLAVDLRRRQVSAGGRPLPLTPAEYAILALLARNPGQAVSHDQLLAEIHRASSGERDARDVLKVHIWRLRAKLLQAVGDDDAIVTVRGYGYLLERRGGKDRRTT